MDLTISLQHLSVFEQIIAAVFLLAAIIQLLYYFLVFSKLAFHKEDSKQNTDQQLPVSIIIAAHNEDYNLQNNLPAILNQNYHDFEVVVVNHASNDNTTEILMDLQRKFSNLKVVNIDQDS